jgi:hypothetical protein
MLYFCDAGDVTWFRLEHLGEASLESQAMDHAVEKYFKRYYDEAVRTYQPPASSKAIERNIGLKDHILKTMPRFLTLRDNDGKALVTAMLPPEGQEDALRPVIVGHGNGDPYPLYGEAIQALGRHVGLQLDRPRCYPYSGR